MGHKGAENRQFMRPLVMTAFLDLQSASELRVTGELNDDSRDSSVVIPEYEEERDRGRYPYTKSKNNNNYTSKNQILNLFT